MPTRACTDFLVKASDGTCIVGRSMEWGADLKSRVWLYPDKQARSSKAPDGKPGLSWQSKYGYIGLDGNNMAITLDGLNEKGLSLELLWLPGTIYQSVPESASSTAVNLLDLGDYVLGNFKSVAEVKAEIGKVRVWAPECPEWGGMPTAHLAIHDDSGASAVIEFINGEQKVHDNPVHVLTNAPAFDWHLTNLANYSRLSAANPKPVTAGGAVLAPPGQGAGFLGVPGDWTPPSRFVRTFAMLEFAKTPANTRQGVNLAMHILNAVDIPLGDVRQSSGDLNYCDYTQWSVIKDLTNRVFYFRSYNNSSLKAIDLKKLDFNKSAKPHVLVPIEGRPSKPFAPLDGPDYFEQLLRN